MTRLQNIIAIITFIALGLVSSSAAAQSKVLVLLTETTTVADESSEAFWWQSSSQVAWTPTDEALLRSADGLEFVRPSDVSRMSRIYRRPRLSDANAAALAELFGADMALVGTVERKKLGVQPLGAGVFEVSIKARLVQPTAEGARIKQSFALDRAARGDRVDALPAATNEAARTLARLVESAVQRRVGPVGVSTDELVITLKEIPSLSHFRAIREKLVERPDVDAVDVAWMAEGIIAVTVNPDAPDTEESVRRIAQGLRNSEFEGFALVSAGDAGAASLRVKTSATP